MKIFGIILLCVGIVIGFSAITLFSDDSGSIINGKISKTHGTQKLMMFLIILALLFMLGGIFMVLVDWKVIDFS